jgi:hypothetical protein
MIFVIYGAEMELWLKNSSALTYADDTSSSVTGNTMNEVKEKLETNANWGLRFMASNGLVANPAKTTPMVLNYESETKLEIRVGNSTIPQESSSKLLGVKINENETWKTQILEKGVVIPALKQ